MPRRAWKQIALDCIHAARDKKAQDMLLLDLRSLCPVADWFVVMSASNPAHAAALADAISQVAKKKHGLSNVRVDGRDHYHWTIVDLTNVMVHIFEPNARGYYAIERLWGDAKRIKA